jgi:hypothetical protein
MDIYIHSAIHFHGLVLNWLSTGKILPAYRLDDRKFGAKYLPGRGGRDLSEDCLVGFDAMLYALLGFRGNVLKMGTTLLGNLGKHVPDCTASQLTSIIHSPLRESRNCRRYFFSPLPVDPALGRTQSPITVRGCFFSGRNAAGPITVATRCKE